MKTKEEKIDAVKMMREIRDRMHKEDDNHPEKRAMELERVRKKYMKSDTNSIKIKL